MQGEGFATLALKTKELNTAIYSPFDKVPVTSLTIIDMCQPSGEISKHDKIQMDFV